MSVGTIFEFSACEERKGGAQFVNEIRAGLFLSLPCLIFQKVKPSDHLHLLLISDLGKECTSVKVDFLTRITWMRA